MAEFVRVGCESISERELFAVKAASPDDVPSLAALPGPYFACLIAWDASSVQDEVVLRLARKLLRAGCVYVCCWGPDCERVHDLFDQAELELRPDGPIAISTWHSDEPLSEALWFMLFNADPDPAYFEGCRAGVGITIGSPAWAAEVREAFSDSGSFSKRVLSKEKGQA
jgi:hypothetical protein